MEYRIKALTEIDSNISSEPFYWYSLECQSITGEWFMLRVVYTLLDLYHVVLKHGLNWNEIPVINRIKVY